MSSEHLVCSKLYLPLSVYPALTWSKEQMWEVMTACVILHNMIIESERDNPVYDVEPHEWQGPLANVDHQVPAGAFAAILARRQEIRHNATHHQLQNDLVEHLWRLKGEN